MHSDPKLIQAIGPHIQDEFADWVCEQGTLRPLKGEQSQRPQAGVHRVNEELPGEALLLLTEQGPMQSRGEVSIAGVPPVSQVMVLTHIDRQQGHMKIHQCVQVFFGGNQRNLGAPKISETSGLKFSRWMRHHRLQGCLKDAAHIETNYSQHQIYPPAGTTSQQRQPEGLAQHSTQSSVIQQEVSQIDITIGYLPDEAQNKSVGENNAYMEKEKQTRAINWRCEYIFGDRTVYLRSLLLLCCPDLLTK